MIRSKSGKFMGKQTKIHNNSDIKIRGDKINCLDQTFSSGEESREYFTEILRKKLKKPDFRAIERFPVAEEEDILALSDPPCYTACPNPWITDFISERESSKPLQCKSPHPKNITGST